MKPWERVATELKSKQPSIRQRKDYNDWRTILWESWKFLRIAFPRLNKDKFLKAAGYWG